MYIWIFLILILLIIGGFYIYQQNFYKLHSKYNDIPNASNEHIEILFFTVDWCPHCKKAKIPWQTFKKAYHNKTLGTNKTNIRCIEYNVTEIDDKNSSEKQIQDLALAKSMASKYNIDGFPSIKMKRGNEIIDFDSKITTYALEQFVDNMTK